MPDIGRKRGAILVLKAPVIDTLTNEAVTTPDDAADWAPATNYVIDDIVKLSDGESPPADHHLVCTQSHVSGASGDTTLKVSDSGVLTGTQAGNWQVTLGPGAIFDIDSGDYSETRNTTESTSLDKAGATTTTVDSVTLTGTLSFNQDATNKWHQAMHAQNQFAFDLFPFGAVVGALAYRGSLQFDTSNTINATRVQRSLTWTAQAGYSTVTTTEANLKGL